MPGMLRILEYFTSMSHNSLKKCFYFEKTLTKQSSSLTNSKKVWARVFLFTDADWMGGIYPKYAFVRDKANFNMVISSI